MRCDIHITRPQSLINGRLTVRNDNILRLHSQKSTLMIQYRSIYLSLVMLDDYLRLDSNNVTFLQSMVVVVEGSHFHLRNCLILPWSWTVSLHPVLIFHRCILEIVKFLLVIAWMTTN